VLPDTTPLSTIALRSVEVTVCYPEQSLSSYPEGVVFISPG